MSGGQSDGWKEARIYPAPRYLKRQLNEYSEKGRKVQLFLNKDVTPVGDISFVGIDYIQFEQAGMTNPTMTIPIYSIVYIREVD